MSLEHGASPARRPRAGRRARARASWCAAGATAAFALVVTAAGGRPAGPEALPAAGRRAAAPVGTLAAAGAAGETPAAVAAGARSVETVAAAVVLPAAAVRGEAAVEDLAGHANDPEWDHLPRSGVALSRVLLRWRPDARLLFRHERLNPTDGYVPPAEREALGRIVQRAARLLEAADEQEARAVRAGVARLVAAGRLTGARPARTASFVAGAEPAPAPDVRRASAGRRTRVSRQTAYHFDGERVFRVPLADLPEALEAGAVRDAVTGELVAAVTAFFHARGLLPAGEARRIRGELHAAASVPWRPSK